jgi:hypothetical protein
MDKEPIVEDQLTPDPGEMEGSKKDPRAAADDMSADHPRFREVYAKMKSYERELETIKESWKNTDKLIDGMRSHNQRLAEALEKAATREKPEEKEEDHLSKIEAQIKELRNQKKKAMEDLMYADAEDIQDRIEDLKEQRLFVKAKVQQQSTKRPERKVPDEDMRAFDQFTQENEWYNDDPLMRAAAIQLDAILVADPKWGSKPLGDRLNEVKKRVEKRFNYQSEETERSRPNAAAVDSGRSGSPRSSSDKSNSLSPEEEAVARGLKLTNEQYIKQKRMGGV